jgi:hypothetical protein
LIAGLPRVDYQDGSGACFRYDLRRGEQGFDAGKCDNVNNDNDDGDGERGERRRIPWLLEDV